MDATRFDDIPGIECWRLDAGVHVEIARDAVPEAAPADSAIGREWSRLSALNPRLFDGTLLAVRGFEPASGQILAKRERYQRLAVQPTVQTGVRMLGVTAVLVSREGGATRLMLGRRGERVGVYPGMWEFGPSGGVVSPPLSVQRLDASQLWAHLEDEIAEELGVNTLEHRGASPQVLVRDAVARSDDVCFVVEVSTMAAHQPNWEYSEVRWVEAGELDAFERAERDSIIPPTRALMRILNWVEEDSK